MGKRINFTHYVCERMSVAQLCTTLCDPMDCITSRLLCPWNSPGKNTRVVAIPFSRRSSWHRDQTQVARIAAWFFSIETPGKPHMLCILPQLEMFSKNKLQRQAKPGHNTTNKHRRTLEGRKKRWSTPEAWVFWVASLTLRYPKQNGAKASSREPQVCMHTHACTHTRAHTHKHPLIKDFPPRGWWRR